MDLDTRFSGPLSREFIRAFSSSISFSFKSLMEHALHLDGDGGAQ